MSTPSTTVVASFRCLPGQERAWLSVWSALAQAALTRPGCEAFTVLPSVTGDGRTAVVSRWEESDGFDRFVRSVGLTWLDYSLYCPVIPARIDRYSSVPRELVDALVGQKAEAMAGVA